MSVDYLHASSSPPLKRLRDTPLSLPTILNTKCGEIFVNNNWDKWSFNCALCQKTTSDIGVFICHIRLEHEEQRQTSNDLAKTLNNSTTIDSSITQTNIFPTCEEHTSTNIPQQSINNPEVFPSIVLNTGTISKIINLETLTDPAERSDKQQNDNSNKNSTTTTTHYSQQKNDESLALSSTDLNSQHQQLQTQEQPIIQVVYNGDDNDYNEFETYHLDIANYLDCNLKDNDNDNTMIQNDNNIPHAGRVYTRKIKKKDLPFYIYKCQLCDKLFKSKQGRYFHYVTKHDKNLHLRLPFKCKICGRGFKTSSGLSTHKIFHKKKKIYKCPICSSKQYREYLFLNHLQTHETDKCFPCQVCGKVYETDAERMEHWETHAKERPYACKFCFRRFFKEQYLIQHVKKHFEYKCYFCPITFKADDRQKIPYVCPSCQQTPDINEKVQHIRNLQKSSHLFDSDEEEEM